MVIYTLAFTYKKNVKACDRDKVTNEDYDPVLDMINQSGKVISYVFEYDSLKRKHIHGIAELDHKVKYRQMKLKGFSSLWKKIFDYQGWCNYLKKDQDYATSLVHEITQLIMTKDYEAQLGSEKPTDKQTEVKVPLRTLSLRRSDDDEPLTPVEGRIEVPTKKLF